MLRTVPSRPAATCARIKAGLHPPPGRGQEGITCSPSAEEGVGLREILASGEAAFTLGIVAEKSRAGPGRSRGPVAAAPAQASTVWPTWRWTASWATPRWRVTIDREKALRYGLEPDALARELRNRIQGTVATTYNEIEQRIDIAVRLDRGTSAMT